MFSWCIFLNYYFSVCNDVIIGNKFDQNKKLCPNFSVCRGVGNVRSGKTHRSIDSCPHKNSVQLSNEAPVIEAPVVEAPVFEVPVVEAPVVEAPVVDVQVVEFPVIEAPVLDVPVLEVPVLELSVVDVPVDEFPEVFESASETPIQSDSVDMPLSELDPNVANGKYQEIIKFLDLYEQNNLEKKNLIWKTEELTKSLKIAEHESAQLKKDIAEHNALCQSKKIEDHYIQIITVNLLKFI